MKQILTYSYTILISVPPPFPEISSSIPKEKNVSVSIPVSYLGGRVFDFSSR